MIADPKFNTAKEWFEKLRDNLIETIPVSYTHLTLPTTYSV